MPCHALGVLDVHVDAVLPELASTAPRVHAVAVECALGPAGVLPPVPASARRLGHPADAAGPIHVLADAGTVETWLGDDAHARIAGLRPGTRALRVQMEPAPSCSAATLRHLLLDQVLPRVAFHLGACVLHGGGVVVGGQAVVALGTTGAGKSSLVAACHAAGAPVLSDDTVILDVAADPPEVEGWYPSLRLGGASHRALLPGTAQGEPMREAGGKHRLLLGPADHAARAPLGVLVALRRGVARVPAVTPLPMPDAVTALASSMLRLLPHDAARSTQELDQLALVLRKRRVLRLDLPDDIRVLPQAVGLLADAVARLGPRA